MAKKKAKKKAAKKACRESLVVASKVKAYIKSKKMMTSSDALCAISDKVYIFKDVMQFEVIRGGWTIDSQPEA